MDTDSHPTQETDGHERQATKKQKNIILIGVMASGKSSIAWRLARMVGYGCLDLDQRIEEQAGKSVDSIFNEEGEAIFRQKESHAIEQISSIRNHVVAVGGGAVLDDQNWDVLRKIGVTVWLNALPSEIARRLVMKPGEIRGRPLIADIANIEDKQTRFAALNDRVESLVGQRRQRYSQADIAVEDAYSTPEAAALRVKELLEESGFFSK